MHCRKGTQCRTQCPWLQTIVAWGTGPTAGSQTTTPQPEHLMTKTLKNIPQKLVQLLTCDGRVRLQSSGTKFRRSEVCVLTFWAPVHRIWLGSSFGNFQSGWDLPSETPNVLVFIGGHLFHMQAPRWWVQTSESGPNGRPGVMGPP